jgi:hypothetical protein
MDIDEFVVWEIGKRKAWKSFGPEPGEACAGILRRSAPGPSFQEASCLLLGVPGRFQIPPFSTGAEAYQLGPSTRAQNIYVAYSTSSKGCQEKNFYNTANYLKLLFN